MTRQRFPKLLRPFVVLLLGIAIINLMATSGRAGDDHKTFKKQPYQGSLDRKYTVHVPDNIDRLPKPVPLVVVLHGCDEDNDKIQHDTNFDAVADQEGFITLYPYITDSSRQNACWGWWMPEEIHKGKGEVEDLNLLIQEVQKNYPIDKTHTHITGISAGGGMAVDVMMAHPELIASGATTAGLPYSETTGAVSWFVCELPGSFNSVDQDVSAMDAEMGSGKKFIPIYIVHSYGDCMLKIQASKNIRDAWGKEFGIDTANPTASESGETLGTAWTHTTYGDSSKRIETLFVGGAPQRRAQPRLVRGPRRREVHLPQRAQHGPAHVELLQVLLLAYPDGVYHERRRRLHQPQRPGRGQGDQRLPPGRGHSHGRAARAVAPGRQRGHGQPGRRDFRVHQRERPPGQHLLSAAGHGEGRM